MTRTIPSKRITSLGLKKRNPVKVNVPQIAQGYECGIGLEKFADIKEGDILEAFIMEEYRD